MGSEGPYMGVEIITEPPKNPAGGPQITLIFRLHRLFILTLLVDSGYFNYYIAHMF